MSVLAYKFPTMAATRKTPQTWIAAGLKALPKQGPDGIRAETLARTLGATKGSFYWHFKDVPAFQKLLLEAWLEGAEKRLLAAIGAQEAANSRLRALSGFKQTNLDKAVRAWAQHDSAARKAVAEFDKQALREITACLQALDATHPDFPGLVFASMIEAPKDGTHTETLVDLLLVLK